MVRVQEIKFANPPDIPSDTTGGGFFSSFYFPPRSI